MSGVLPTYWTDWIADSQGFWKANGLEPETTLTNTAAGGTQALLANAVVISDSGVDATIQADLKGADIVDVADTITAPLYSVVVKNTIHSYGDLKGKKIAISDLQSGPTIMLKRILAANGLKDTDVTLIQSGGTPARVAALQSGAVDAGMLLPPFDFQLLDKGFSILGYTTDVIKKQTFNAINVRKSWASSNRDTLVRFLKVKKQSVDWLYDAKNKDAATELLATKLKVPTNIASQSYDTIVTKVHMFNKDLAPAPEAIQDVITTLSELNLVPQPLPKPQQFMDTSFVEQALKG